MKKMNICLLCGLLGCLLMGASDWLMIYGDTGFQGSLAWLTVGAAAIAPWRNGLAMGLAFPAVILYAVGLLGLKQIFPAESHRKTYGFLTTVGMTPWLCLHLFYVMILYLFAWLSGSGFASAAFPASEALFRQFSWLVLAGEAIMVLPFVYFLVQTARGKSLFSRWMALNSPLLWYVGMKAVTLVLPDTPARLAFVNGLMSEAMAVWFAILMIGLKSRKRSLTQ